MYKEDGINGLHLQMDKLWIMLIYKCSKIPLNRRKCVRTGKQLIEKG